MPFRRHAARLYLVLVLSGAFGAAAASQPPIAAHDVSARVERLGNPYQERYPDGETTYARNIWDMRVFQGALYLGAGNSSNVGPAPNAGPVPILRFDPSARSFVREGKVDDEQIDMFQIHDGQLFIPGHDPRENWDWGNFYSREKNAAWIKHRTIPGGLHTYGLAWHQGKLFAALGIRQGAAVAISEDQGKSWTVAPLGRWRAYNFLHVAGKLYASKHIPAAAQWKKMAEAQRAPHYPVYEFTPPNAFAVRSDLTHETLFPGASLQANLATKIVRPLDAGGKSIYIGAYAHNDHQYLPFGVFVATSLDAGQPQVEKIPLAETEQPWDLLLHDGYLYVLTSTKQDGAVRVRVWRAPLNDLAHLSEVLEFSVPTFARSFEILGNDFYFGLGCEVENPKQWRQEELNPETGQILRVRNGLPR